MISHQDRFIFVHIPKTAGSSVTKAFGSEWQNHKDLARYRRELEPEAFESYYKFSVVRNPWERLFSDYNYQRRWSGPRDAKLHIFDSKGRLRKFPAWVQAVFDDPFHYEARHWGGSVSKHIHRWSPQYDWISIDGEVQVDFVARMETLEEDLGQVCRMLNRPPIVLPHMKRRVHWHYSHYYDTATRDLVAEHFQKDIETFGYNFAAKESSKWWKTAFFLSAKVPLILTWAQLLASPTGLIDTPFDGAA